MKAIEKKHARSMGTRRERATRNRELTLYHFTALINLPEIMSGGITRGVVPVLSASDSERPQRVNRTSDPTLKGQQCWTQGDIIDKTRVQLSVRVPKSDVFTFRRAMKTFDISRRELKALAPNRENRHWYFSHSGIRPNQIHQVEVALARRGEFTKLSSAEVANLVEWINEAKSRLKIRDDGKQVFIRIRLFDWISPLLDGPQSLKPHGYPAIPTSAIRSPSIELG